MATMIEAFRCVMIGGSIMMVLLAKTEIGERGGEPRRQRNRDGRPRGASVASVRHLSRAPVRVLAPVMARLGRGVTGNDSEVFPCAR